MVLDAAVRVVIDNLLATHKRGGSFEISSGHTASTTALR